MICPKCRKDLDVAKQLKYADKEWYGGVEPPIMLMIDCPNCEEQVVELHLLPVEGFEEIDSKIGKVKIPKV